MADRAISGDANIWVPVVDIERALDFCENTPEFCIPSTHSPTLFAVGGSNR